MMEIGALVSSSIIVLSCSANQKALVSGRYFSGIPHLFRKTRRCGLHKPTTYISQADHARPPLPLPKTNGKIEPDGKCGDEKGKVGYLVKEYGWRVRRMVEEQSEIRKVAQVQAEAFHVPVVLFNDLFFQFFQAEVLSGLLYRLRNSPPERYACLVAEASTDTPESRQELVGVVDVTVLRDKDVLQHLSEAEEYLYVSGIAVLNNFRRKKVATALLKACEVVSDLWGFEYLVLRAYEDDLGALKLYGIAGYRIVAGDPPWMTTWIGRKRRVLMIKCPNS
ncbi:GCN5-related N-acetyltransferase 10, chloroplastic [Sarracenia purpurea var. burkii]